MIQAEVRELLQTVLLFTIILAFALPCVSALTCQSLKNITKVKATDEEIFKESLSLASSDWDHIDAIKVGLISDDNLLTILLDALKTTFKDVPVVWDPVLCGTAGDLTVLI